MGRLISDDKYFKILDKLIDLEIDIITKKEYLSDIDKSFYVSEIINKYSKIKVIYLQAQVNFIK